MLDKEFRNAVIRKILGLDLPKLRMILPDAVKQIIDGTPAHSGLYRWLLDHLASVLAPNDLEKIEHMLPQSVLLPLLKRMISGRRCPLITPDSCHPRLSHHQRYIEKSRDIATKAEENDP